MCIPLHLPQIPLIPAHQHVQKCVYSLIQLQYQLPSSFTMSIRRSKTMPTDGPTAKFLYTIIKQLDLKSVRCRPAMQSQVFRANSARLTGTSSLRSSKSPTATPPECASRGSSNKWRARRLHHALRVRRRTVAKQRTRIIPKQDYRRSLFHLHRRGLRSSRNTRRLRLTIHTRVHISRPIHTCRGFPRWKTSHRLKDGHP